MAHTLLSHPHQPEAHLLHGLHHHECLNAWRVIVYRITSQLPTKLSVSHSQAHAFADCSEFPLHCCHTLHLCNMHSMADLPHSSHTFKDLSGQVWSAENIFGRPDSGSQRPNFQDPPLDAKGALANPEQGEHPTYHKPTVSGALAKAIFSVFKKKIAKSGDYDEELLGKVLKTALNPKMSKSRREELLATVEEMRDLKYRQRRERAIEENLTSHNFEGSSCDIKNSHKTQGSGKGSVCVKTDTKQALHNTEHSHHALLPPPSLLGHSSNKVRDGSPPPYSPKPCKGHGVTYGHLYGRCSTPSPPKAHF